jgi:hypothetical protein
MSYFRLLGRTTQNLSEHLQSLPVESTTRLEYHSDEVIVRILKSSIITTMFLKTGIVLARFLFVQMGGSHWANHSHINSETTVWSPFLEGNVTWAPSGSISRAK